MVSALPYEEPSPSPCHETVLVWYRRDIGQYVAAEQRGAAAERERIVGQLRQLPANDPHAHATARWIEMFGGSR